MGKKGRTDRMAGNGEMAVIFVMPATTATMQKAATTEITGTTGTGAIAATTAITGARGPRLTAKTATGPQVVARLTVRPAPHTATARSVTTVRSVMIAMVRAGGLRARRAMTGRAAMTVRIGPTVPTGQIVQTVRIVMAGRIVMAVRTGRTETAVGIRTVAPTVGETEARAVAPVVAPAGIKTVAVRAGKTNALARVAASPSWPNRH